jgi:hypothetical protein
MTNDERMTKPGDKAISIKFAFCFRHLSLIRHSPYALHVS